jgi:hypothetical protein
MPPRKKDKVQPSNDVTDTTIKTKAKTKTKISKPRKPRVPRTKTIAKTSQQSPDDDDTVVIFPNDSHGDGHDGDDSTSFANKFLQTVKLLYADVKAPRTVLKQLFIKSQMNKPTFSHTLYKAIQDLDVSYLRYIYNLCYHSTLKHYEWSKKLQVRISATSTPTPTSTSIIYSPHKETTSSQESTARISSTIVSLPCGL